MLTRLAHEHLLGVLRPLILQSHCCEVTVRNPAANEGADVDLVEAGGVESMQSSTPAGTWKCKSPSDERSAGLVSVIVLPTRSVSHWVKRKEIMKSRSCRN